MIKLPSLAWILALAITGHVFAQGLPGTDLWLVNIEDGVIGQPTRISDGDGYNNQPHFSNDGQVVYYTREMPSGDGSQTDIAVYNVQTSATAMITNTAESEYSPTPVPGRNAVSVIRQDLQQKQFLWAVDTDNGSMELLFPDIEPVGYHAWYSDDSVAMFILGESFTLQLAKLGSEGAKRAAENIGRSLRKHPASGEVLFVDKNTAPWQIAALDPETGQTTGVMPLFPGSEDFTIDSSGNYWTGNGSKLYRRSPDDKRWKLMADFSAHGIGNISRLAVHLESGKIAVVGEQTAL